MHTPKNVDDFSVQGLLDWAKECIASQDDLSFQSPSLEARLLFTFATKKSHTWIIINAAHKASDCISCGEIENYISVVQERLLGKPIAFILGTQDFWSLTLKVSDCTLIPRQDTETLVETVLSLESPKNANVLDLGTGTGAIALALAKEHPKWHVTGIDKFPQAIELARENGLLNSVDATFLQSDWFSAFNSKDRQNTFDIIVTNPPYVEAGSEYVQQGDLRFEPLSALVSGVDGLDDIRHIIIQSKAHLNEQAYLVIEHGHKQHENVQLLLCEAGFTDVKSVSDMNKIERITLGRWPGKVN
jgi:release factor glutamine methyltransferase